FTYGIHWAGNAVCGEVGEGAGVLLRAMETLAGVDAMRALRPAARRDRDLASGPGKLEQAMGLDRGFDGADLVTGDRGILIVDDGTTPPAERWVGPRIGISGGVGRPWRWHVAGHPSGSVRR